MYTCDLCGHPTGDPRKTDVGLICEDCAKEADTQAEYYYQLNQEGKLNEI